MSDFLNGLIDLATDDGNDGFDEFDNIPKGTYAASIVSAEHKSNNAGTGELVKVEFFLDGIDRRAWAYYNVGHQKPIVAKRGIREFRALVAATGLTIGGDEKFECQSLEGRRLSITIDHDKSGDTVWDRVTNPQPIAATNRQAEAAPAGAGDSERPWERES